jgi:hypothetical protein
MAAINRRTEVIVLGLAALLGQAAAVLEISSHSFVMEGVLYPTKFSTKPTFDGAELWLKQVSHQQRHHLKERDIDDIICIIAIGHRGNRKRR